VSDRFPWAELMELGFGRLRLAPRDFWAMTLKELHAALPKREPMSRADLEALIQQFPDE
jgi:uncharacterized phage protein (TIGR02216 family)